VARHTVFLALAGAVTLLIGGPIAVPMLFGHKFAGAVAPMLWLLPGLVMMALYQILTRNFTSRGKQEINIIAAVLALGLNVGLNVVLIPRWGIVGAAIANDLRTDRRAGAAVAFVKGSGTASAKPPCSAG
jgi:O-antigen/teichoic acid export membrane protein